MKTLAIVTYILLWGIFISVLILSSKMKEEIRNIPCNKTRDYQLELVVDTVLVFDGNRLVGKIPLYYIDDSRATNLDSLIYIDND